MPQPTAYDREFSFTNFQASNPSSPPPGNQLDAEFNAVKDTLDEVLANLAVIQRDDGDLANLSVGLEQLAADLSIGISPPRVWTTATAYSASPVDTVFQGSAFYRCKVSHTSGSFASDLAALKWELIVDLSTIPLVNASQIAFAPAGGVSSTTVQAAIVELDSEKAASSHTHPATQISDSTAIGRSILTAADAAAVVSLLPVFPAGAIIDYAGAVAPAGWLLCGGQAVSRAAFAALFAVIGTLYGAGDGSTTFNVPDCQGRVTAGKDNMSGVSANRLTNQPGGLDGDVLGSFGGLENHQLTLAQLASHDHGGNTGAGTAHFHLEFNNDNSPTVPTGSNFAARQNLAGTDNNYDLGASGTTPTLIKTSSESSHTHPVAGAGSDAAHNNVQPTIILNKIIKT